MNLTTRRNGKSRTRRHRSQQTVGCPPDPREPGSLEGKDHVLELKSALGVSTQEAQPEQGLCAGPTGSTRTRSRLRASQARGLRFMTLNTSGWKALRDLLGTLEADVVFLQEHKLLWRKV